MTGEVLNVPLVDNVQNAVVLGSMRIKHAGVLVPGQAKSALATDGTSRQASTAVKRQTEKADGRI